MLIERAVWHPGGKKARFFLGPAADVQEPRAGPLLEGFAQRLFRFGVERRLDDVASILS